jgi:hypothetical protein
LPHLFDHDIHITFGHFQMPLWVRTKLASVEDHIIDEKVMPWSPSNQGQFYNIVIIVNYIMQLIVWLMHAKILPGSVYHLISSALKGNMLF